MFTNKYSLSKDLLKSILWIYIIITVIVTTGHVIVDFTYTQKRIKNELQKISQTFKPILKTALIDMNHVQISTISEGIMHMDIIYGITIKDINGNILIKHEDPKHIMNGKNNNNEIPYTFSIHKNFNNHQIYLAEVTLRSGRCAVMKQLKVDFFMIMLNDFIQSIALILLIILAFRKHLGAPLEELTNKVSQFSWYGKGKRRINMRFHKKNELSILLSKFNELLQKISNEEVKRIALTQHHTEDLENKVEERTEELKRINEKLYFLAETDTLTELYNRSKLENELNINYEYFQRYRRIFSIILIDIDHFKNINDTYGHDIGDKTLIKIADILKSYTRKTDIVGRWGGEEFLIVCSETRMKNAYHLAETLRRVIDNTDFINVGHISASFGIAQIENNIQLHDLVKHADIALYNAKDNGRNCTETFSKKQG